MKYTLFIIGMLVATFSANAQSQLYPQHFDLAEVTLLDSPFQAKEGRQPLKAVPETYQLWLEVDEKEFRG